MTRRWLAMATLLIFVSGTIGYVHADGQRGGSSPVAPNTPERSTVTSDGHPITLWARKPPSGTAQKGSVLLVHGLTWSGRPDFDLQVPGLGLQRSVLASLAT